MQIVYQLARRCVVRIEAADSVGSGIIWKIEDDRIVIASNRHLLMKDVEAKVTFFNNEAVQAEILGYSQQYDIGYLYVAESDINSTILRDIYEAVPLMYDVENSEDVEEFNAEYADKAIIQIGAILNKAGENPEEKNFYRGKIDCMRFEELFNSYVLVTDCYSKGGMSGGGVFDTGGRFIGMISGGNVPDDSRYKAADVTYSLPAYIVETEFFAVCERAGR